MGIKALCRAGIHAVTLLVLFSGCGGAPQSTTDPVVQDTLLSIEVRPNNPTLAKGTTQELVATGIYSRNGARDVSAEVTWASNNRAIASLGDAAGQISALTTGSVTLTASLDGVSGTTTLTVTDATLTSIGIEPSAPRLAAGTRMTLLAQGYFSDGSTQDLSLQVGWASDAPEVATVGDMAADKGLLAAEVEGSARITATLSGVTATITVSTTAVELTAIQITPASPSLPAGTELPLSATGLFSDGSAQDLSSQVVWSVNDSGPAAVDGQGRVSALGPGSTEVRANLAGITGTTVLTVTAATLTAIEVSPAAATLPLGRVQQLVAQGRYSDGRVQDISAQVIWQSSQPARVTVSNTGGAQGWVSALGQGVAAVTATLDDISGSATLTVTDATLVSIDIEPMAPRLVSGSRLALDAIGRYSDGSIRELTTEVVWQADDPAVAVLDNSPEGAGTVLAGTPDDTYISATLENVTGSTMLTVTDATLTAINILPADISLAAGVSVALTAMGDYSDGSSQDLTDQVVWASSQATVVAVSTAGELTAAQTGTSRVTASLAGTAGSIPVSVTDATLSSLAISPASVTLAAGIQTSLRATATYSDGSTQDVTRQAVWSSDDDGIARVDNGEGRRGVLSAVAVGDAMVSAAVAGQVATSIVSVDSATLESLEILPAGLTLPSGASQTFTAIGTFTNDSTQDLTDQVIWTSSNPTLAQISNVEQNRGRLTAGVTTGGVTTLSAHLGTIMAEVDLTVSYQPQWPVSLVVLATPNVVHNDDTDTVTLTVQVQAADPATTVADGTLIDVELSDGTMVWQNYSLVTSSGVAAQSLTIPATRSGLLFIRASVQSNPSVSNTTVIYATATVPEVVLPAAFLDAVVVAGQVQEGGRFGFLLFNSSNRVFPLRASALCNGAINAWTPTDLCGDAEALAEVYEPSMPYGNLLPGGAVVTFVVTLDNAVADQGLKAVFMLDDPSTGRSFIYSVTYSPEP